jgi:hypothetical protein
MSVYVTKKVDENVPPNRWIASLSNGETVFEDRKEGEPIAWERLAEYVRLHDLSITQLRVQFENGSEVKLPANAEGYVQKKKAWSTGAHCGASFCIGYVGGGLSMIHELGPDMSSVTKYDKDPGEPWVIYRKDLRVKRG